ncbi:MAG: HKD family nuclease [Enterobacterales bacterium]|jgi:HKD family nuclease
MKKITSLPVVQDNQIIDTKSITEVLQALIGQANSICFISAFLTSSILQVFKETDFKKNVSLYVRCKPSDCIGGSCDLNVLKQLISKGVSCFVDYKLHAKIYIFDSKDAVIGSSNLTANGLGFSNYPNFELNYSCQLSASDLAQIDNYLGQCVQINISDIEKMQAELSFMSTMSSSDIPDEWETVNLKPKQELLGLFIEDLPKINPFDISKYNEKDIIHDQMILGKKSSDHTKFKQSNVFKFIYHFILVQESKSASFGSITAYLHDHILDDFSPYRREIKVFLQNFISYLEFYESEVIKIKRPNYSQVFYLE